MLRVASDDQRAESAQNADIHVLNWKTPFRKLRAMMPLMLRIIKKMFLKAVDQNAESYLH